MKLNLPVLLLNGTVLMPNDEIKLEFNDELSKNIIDESEYFHDKKIFIVTKLSLEEDISIMDLPSIGTIAKITRKLKLPNGNIRINIKGVERGYVIEYLNPSPNMIESFVSSFPTEEIKGEIKDGLIRKLYSELEEYIEKVPYVSNGILSLISGIDDLGKITDIMASNLSMDNFKKFSYLMEPNSIKRAEMLLEYIDKEEQLFNIEEKIDTKVKKEIDKDQKDFYLKSKIEFLKRELGEISPKEEEVEKLKLKINNLNVNDTIKEKLLYELNRYYEMSNISPELSVVRNYIETMISLPWGIYTEDIEDLSLIKEYLDKTHYGLDEIKDRIIEYLAIKKHSSMLKSPILCLVGPPGVGKTTLAYSIAKSMNRNFVKISVGGVDDEAIIKGHIRTYLGATCGKIIDGIKRAKSSNPVFLIDEIDKMSSNYKGDPNSALLEVLDPNQNKYFKDNYVEEEFDLSKVIFITTANDINDIPLTLRDRLEIINIKYYTEYEKVEIVKKYLIPSICKNHGINNIKISDENIINIIRHYTKESGLRQLERMISKIVRKIVMDSLLSSKRASKTVSNIKKYLGEYIYDTNNTINDIGVVNGLAYSTYGGDVIQVETTYYDGEGNITITGDLGNTMLESAKVALSYIKANYKEFNIDKKIFKSDIHINVPNSKIKKDGPSAGVTITTSIISSLSNFKISNEVAMTGEITLRGNVLKVGGIKEKIMGAYINNIKIVFIPFSNMNDLNKIPNDIKDKMTFVPVKNYKEIYNYLKKHNDI